MSNNISVDENGTTNAAEQRVANSPELSAHPETIFSDWSNRDEYMAWIVSAPESEIVAWAEEIERSK